MNEYIYSFNESREAPQELVGEKGANLIEMTKMGLPIPYGFVVTTEASMASMADMDFFLSLRGEVQEKIGELELVSGRRFACGDEKPLLLAVRSSAVKSTYDIVETKVGISNYEELKEAVSDIVFQPNPKAGRYACPAVVIQVMLTGKSDEEHLPGEACVSQESHFVGTFYTRNPETGENDLTGELFGNDENFQKIAELLEKRNKAVMEIKYMIEDGKFNIIHAVRAKLTAKATIKVAADMVAAGLIDKKTAVRAVSPKQLDEALRKDMGELSEEMKALMGWADEIRTLKIRANAENLKELEDTTALGADGIEIATVINTPYMALTCADLVNDADYMSFDMDALTTLIFGYSREFEPIDEKSVGRLVSLAANSARKAKPRIKLGLRVNSGMDYETVAFCVKAGLDYMTCEPNQVLIARFFAAQAKLELEK